jgi:hypothetical protein
MSVELQPFSWKRVVEAVEAVHQRACRAAAALESASIPYAIAGGNAVAAWVARRDRAAVRNTQDVDILVRRADFEAVKRSLESVGFEHHNVLGVDCFIDGGNGNPRDSVHLIYSGEKVKPEYVAPNADVSESESGEHYRILSLEALVRMKLNSFRRKDQVHLLDLMDVGLLDGSWLSRLHDEHARRLQHLFDTPED